MIGGWGDVCEALPCTASHVYGMLESSQKRTLSSLFHKEREKPYVHTTMKFLQGMLGL